MSRFASLESVWFECKTSNDFVFHRHRTKHHGSIDALQISKKVKHSRRPAPGLQALLFSFVNFLYASSKLANNDLADFLQRGFIECSAIECDVKKVFVEVAYCRLIKIHPYHDNLSFNIRRLRFPTRPARLFQSKFWPSDLLLASCNEHLHPDHLAVSRSTIRSELHDQYL